MSRHAFDPKCHDCRPVLLEPSTGKVLPASDPLMQAFTVIWDGATREDQDAYHRACVLNSRDPADLACVRVMMDRLKAATLS